MVRCRSNCRRRSTARANWRATNCSSIAKDILLPAMALGRTDQLELKLSPTVGSLSVSLRGRRREAKRRHSDGAAEGADHADASRSGRLRAVSRDGEDAERQSIRSLRNSRFGRHIERADVQIVVELGSGGCRSDGTSASTHRRSACAGASGGSRPASGRAAREVDRQMAERQRRLASKSTDHDGAAAEDARGSRNAAVPDFGGGRRPTGCRKFVVPVRAMRGADILVCRDSLGGRQEFSPAMWYNCLMSKLAVIFDMDGVLVDSYHAHFVSWTAVCMLSWV